MCEIHVLHHNSFVQATDGFKNFVLEPWFYDQIWISSSLYGWYKIFINPGKNQFEMPYITKLNRILTMYFYWYIITYRAKFMVWQSIKMYFILLVNFYDTRLVLNCFYFLFLFNIYVFFFYWKYTGTTDQRWFSWNFVSLYNRIYLWQDFFWNLKNLSMYTLSLSFSDVQHKEFDIFWI